jgi:hypothetical protein
MAMCRIQNVTRKDGTYYFRRLIRLGADKPFRLRFSLKTTNRKRAALLAPAMTLICGARIERMERKARLFEQHPCGALEAASIGRFHSASSEHSPRLNI